MLNTTSPSDLLTTWATTATSLSNAALNMTTAMTETTLSLWSSALPASGPQVSARPASAPAELPRPAVHTARSWYRAPYRSPFDPMFWLNPVGATGEVPWSWPGMPQLPFTGANQRLAMPWLMAMPWYQSSPVNLGAADLASSAYAAYRSMGGHAVAQVIMPAMLPSVTNLPLPGRAASPVDALMRAAFPWLMR